MEENEEMQLFGGERFDAEKVKWTKEGLVPAIVVDAGTKEVLTLAYMNRESLQRSMETGETWFYSRSREALWHKGETSGNIQKILSISLDCDGDALLVQVRPTGPACHTGEWSCFHQPVWGRPQSVGSQTAEAQIIDTLGAETQGATAQEAAAQELAIQQVHGLAVLSQLEETVAKRDERRPEGSYTTYLFEKGLDKILKKVGEETSEVIIAAKNRNPEELRCEVSDLLYHLFVLLREQGLSFSLVLDELKNRMKPEEKGKPKKD